MKKSLIASLVLALALSTGCAEKTSPPIEEPVEEMPVEEIEEESEPEPEPLPIYSGFKVENITLGEEPNTVRFSFPNETSEVSSVSIEHYLEREEGEGWVDTKIIVPDTDLDTDTIDIEPGVTLTLEVEIHDVWDLNPGNYRILKYTKDYKGNYSTYIYFTLGEDGSISKFNHEILSRD